MMRFLTGFVITLALHAHLVQSQFGDDEEGGSPDPYDSYDDMMKGMGGMGGAGGASGYPGDYGGYGGYDEYDGYGGGGGGMGGMGGMGKPAATLGTTEDIDAFIGDLESDQAGVLGYFDDATDSESIDDFKEIALKHGDAYRFAMVTEKNILEDKKVGGPLVYVYKSLKFFNEKYGEKKRARYPGSVVKSNSLENFVYEKSVPLVGEFGSTTQGQYDNVKLPVVVAFGDFDHDRNEKHYTYLVNRVRRVAQKYGGKAVFAVASKSSNEAVLRSFELEDIVGDVNTIGMGIVHQDQCFKMEGDALETKFSSENMENFVAQYLGGALEGKGLPKNFGSSGAYNPPAQEPEDEDMAPEVEVLTGDNFEEKVTASSGDVMLEFYAPWCGHCKHLKPEYSELAKHYSGDEGITIAAMDATAHTPPSSFDVQGFPTLIYLTKDKQQIPYDGDREKGAMVEWIEKHRST